jgi:hypothetical protein
MIATLLLPGLAAVPIDLADRFVAIPGTVGPGALFGAPAGRDDGTGVSPFQCVVYLLLIVGTVAKERLQFGVDLFQQRQRCCPVVRARVGHELSQDCVRVGIDCQVDLPPVSPFVRAVLADLSFPLAIDLQTRAIDDNVDGSRDGGQRDFHAQFGRPLDQAGVMRDRDVHVQQLR